MTGKADPIPFIDLAPQQARLGTKLDAAIGRVLKHGQYILGPEVAELEAALETFTGAPHCVSCANGTDALTLVLMAEGIGPGDAVIVPSFTFVATAETVAQIGATPVFADINQATYNLDSASLARAIEHARNSSLSPRAVIAVDLFGQPADYASISEVAKANDLTLIADAAQSLGASVGGRKVGTMADYTTTSFFPAKPFGCYGDGGAVFVDDAATAEKLRSLRMHGEGESKYDNVRVGLNSRLDTIQAAILLEKLSIFPSEIAERAKIAAYYSDGLRGCTGVPYQPEDVTPVWAVYTITLGPDQGREATRQECLNSGIPTAVYYSQPLHRQPAYTSYPTDPSGLTVSEELSQTVLSLPMHAYLDRQTQDRVIETLANLVKGRP